MSDQPSNAQPSNAGGRTAASTAGANTLWGSDVIADALREQNIPYACLNPGASYRGLHDSMVNYLGNTNPKMIVCLHEEHAVGIAHGYAVVTNKPLIAIVHSNVGLMHATMGIFNAWCNRAPVVMLGATAKSLAEEFDKAWWQEEKNSWTARHHYVIRSRQRLQELAVLSLNALPLHDLQELALLKAEFESAQASKPQRAWHCRRRARAACRSSSGWRRAFG